MGLLDRLAQRVAQEIVKAPNLPAGSVTMTEEQMRSGSNTGTYGQVEGLPRNPLLTSVPFSPGRPIIPGAINPIQERGRPDPRRYEFQVAQNINITATRLVPFTTLRAAADQIDIIRRCIEVLKSKMSGLEWDVTISSSASEKILSENNSNYLRAMADARDKFEPEIARLRSFWEVPDRQNGLIFQDWINVFLEDSLVLDAVAVWGQPSLNGDLYGFQIIDGATIKPLLDDRGMRPLTPHPAYQQILYGFPRGEFTATTDDPKADGEFSADELAYLVRNRRSTTVYGFSPVERSLPVADIYLRRQQWLRAEYTDGVMPELMFETDATFGNNPELLRAYENIFNDDLAGMTEQRKRSRVLPAGMKPIQFDGYGEKFSSTLDDYLVTSICGHFGVLPSEIGFNPKSGLGGSGFQQGEALSAENIGLTPLANWVGRMLTQLSQTYLGMPRELEIKFMDSDLGDDENQSRAEDLKIRSGRKTLNEMRAEDGLPLIETPEADMPMIVAGQGVFFLSPDGIVQVEGAVAASGNVPVAASTETGDGKPSLVAPLPVETPAPSGQKPQPETPNTQAEDPNAQTNSDDGVKAVQGELKAFIKWAKKGTPIRPFKFEAVEQIVGEALNKCASDGDLDTARALVSAYLSE